MKTQITVILIVVFSILTFSLQAAIIQVSAPNDLRSYVNSMNNGDIIELTTQGGIYFWSSQLNITSEKSITIRAKSSLTVRPIVRFSGTGGGFLRYNVTGATSSNIKWNFSGIEFDGKNTSAGFSAQFLYYSTINSNAYGAALTIDNCIIRNTTNGAIQYTGSNSTVNEARGGNLTITNSEFRENGYRAIVTSATLAYVPDDITLDNCLFSGADASNMLTFVELNAMDYNSYRINHCTFINSNQRELRLSNTQSTSSILNSLFVNSVNRNSNNSYNIVLGSSNGIYYTGGGTRTTVYPFSTSVRTTNPVLNATTGIATAATYLTGTTDGLPTGFYGNQIFASETELTDLSYQGTAGPSASKSFVVSATRLTNNISITAPANFEISFNAASGYTSGALSLTQSAGNVAQTSVFVRLKAGLSSNIYNGNISISSTGAQTKYVKLSGTVISQPTIFPGVSSMVGFSYTAGSGPSVQQSFVVNASGLAASLNISAPTNFEISLNSGSNFSGSSSLSISPISGNVTNLNVYVRLKRDLIPQNYSGSISLSSTNATTKSISLTGIVNPAPVTITLSKTSLSNFNYKFGTGPSAIQSFTVSGTGLSGNITLSVPAEYELSTYSGTSFSGNSTLVLSPVNMTIGVTNIYVRLKNNLAVGIYDKKITISTAGATNREVALSGFVSEGTSITLTATTLTGFEYVVNNGPSAEKSFDIAGVNLSTYVQVTSPATYEISTSSGAAFTGSEQLLLDPASINGSTLRIYIRLKKNHAVGAYTGTLSVSSSGATTRTISLNGNVYNQLTIATDPAAYNRIFGNNYHLQNKWILSKNTNNYSYGNELVAASGMARDMALRQGKLLFVDRGNKRIVVINGETGVKENPIVLNPNLFTYTARNVANTADSLYYAGTYQYHSIKVDNANNILVGNLTTLNTHAFQIYKIDPATGNGTILIDQRNMATLFPLSPKIRIDYFGVWGDVNNNAVIVAANAETPAMEIFRWNISNGIVSAPQLIKIDNVTLGNYITGLQSLGGAPHIYPISADEYLVDGGGTYPTLINASGAIVDGFHNAPASLNDITTIPGQSLALSPGNNGVCHFKVGQNYFMAMGATSSTSYPASAFRLYKMLEYKNTFQDMYVMWTFPQAGMGSASNGYRSAIPLVEVNGYTASIYVYCGENGLAKYEMTMNPLSTGVEDPLSTEFAFVKIQNEIVCNQIAQKIMLYDVRGQLCSAANNTKSISKPIVPGVYIVQAMFNNGIVQKQKIIID